MAIKNNIVSCDFCDAEISEKDYLEKVVGWSWGQRGVVMTSGPHCALGFEQKQSCPKELCKAKLLVWARS